MGASLQRSGTRFLLWGLLLFALTGCASSGFGPSRGEEEVVVPWSLSPGDLGTQRLYRATYQGPDGELGFRLTLYLLDRQVYAMSATDGLGRKLWSLSVDRENQALWLDHRRKEFCAVGGANSLEIVPLAGFPLTSLPRLLLGLMPVEPATELADDGIDLSFVDVHGRKWSGSREGGSSLAWWSLKLQGEPAVWWRARGKGGVFSDRRGQQQLTWREVARESLAKEPAPLTVPAGYAEGVCASADASL